MITIESVTNALFNCATNPHPCCICSYLDDGTNGYCQNKLMLDALKIIEQLKGELKKYE